MVLKYIKLEPGQNPHRNGSLEYMDVPHVKRLWAVSSEVDVIHQSPANPALLYFYPRWIQKMSSQISTHVLSRMEFFSSTTNPGHIPSRHSITQYHASIHITHPWPRWSPVESVEASRSFESLGQFVEPREARPSRDSAEQRCSPLCSGGKRGMHRNHRSSMRFWIVFVD